MALDEKIRRFGREGYATYFSKYEDEQTGQL